MLFRCYRCRKLRWRKARIHCGLGEDAVFGRFDSAEGRSIYGPLCIKCEDESLR